MKSEGKKGNFTSPISFLPVDPHVSVWRRMRRAPERLVALAMLVASAALLLIAVYLLAIADAAAAERFYPLLFGLGGLLTMILTGFLVGKAISNARRKRSIRPGADAYVLAAQHTRKDAA